MSSICFIDTSVFLNLLNVPNRNQEHEKVSQDFHSYEELKFTLLLPMATIIETGNHIAQNGDGNIRRQTAQRFVEEVKAAFQGKSPWTPSQFPQTDEILSWIDHFPELAGKNKAPKKMEGTSFGDLSIIQ
jgi:predicted nucleic acid-binding protein